MNREKDALRKEATEMVELDAELGDLHKARRIMNFVDKFGSDHEAITSKGEAQDFQQEQWDALANMAPRERIVKVWSTPTVSDEEASRLFHRCNPAGNNQIEKAHFQQEAKKWTNNK